MTTTKQSSSRRRFLKTAGTSAAGVLLAGMPKGFSGGVYAADGPETARCASASSRSPTARRS
jgi:hypothetical protein